MHQVLAKTYLLWQVSFVLLTLLGNSIISRHSALSPLVTCNVSGLLTTNTTWGPSMCDLYIATANVVVDQNVTLTIQPGTIIKFDSNVVLTVRGTLIARGTSNNNVVFTSNQLAPAKGDWAGIGFVDSSIDATWNENGDYVGGSVIQHSIVEYAGANGAISIDRAYPFIDNNIIRNNGRRGIYIDLYTTLGDATVLYITNNIIQNNDALSAASGAGIYLFSGSAVIHGNSIRQNTTTLLGGGLYLEPRYKLTLSNNTVSDNSAFGNGGGVSIRGGAVSMQDNTIAGNASASSGGGVYLYLGAYDMRHNVIKGNSAQNGGGILFAAGSPNGSVIDNVIISNTATSEGGGIYSTFPPLNVTFAVNYNDLYGNMANSNPNDFTYAAYQSYRPDINAKNNWWGTTDPTVIESHIFHYIDSTGRGLVLFEPYCTEPCEQLRVFLPMIQK